jgi:hypothetical protein
VTSISFAASSCSNVSWVPQRGQKVRIPFGLDLNRVGTPCTSRNSDRGTLNQATNGAPVVRRQIEQWQFVK